MSQDLNGMNTPTGRSNSVRSLERVYNTRLANFMMSAYNIALFFEYLCLFPSLPFDEIINRPPICILTIFFTFVTFIASASLSPLQFSTLPNHVSYRFHIASTLIQAFVWVFNIIAVVCVFRTSEGFYISSERTENGTIDKLDLTVYIRVVTSLLFSISSIVLIFQTINTWIYARALFRFVNKQVRVANPEDGPTSPNSNRFKCGEMICCGQDEESKFHNEVLAKVEENFIL